MKPKKLPLTERELPGLDLEKVRYYDSHKFDELGAQVIDYGNHALVQVDSTEQAQALRRHLDVEPLRTWVEDQARDLIRKSPQPNNFTAAAYPVGEIETGPMVVIALRFSIYANGSERKIWRVFLATEEGLDEIRKSMTEDIEATAQKMNDLTERLGGGVN